MADFREQLLTCAGVDPARVVEFSCGERARVAGRGHLPLRDQSTAVCLCCWFVSPLSIAASFLAVVAAKGCQFPSTLSFLSGHMQCAVPSSQGLGEWKSELSDLGALA